MAYSVECMETGCFIDEFPTKKEALQCVEEYENEDKENGVYSPDFYAVRDLETDELI